MLKLFTIKKANGNISISKTTLLMDSLATPVNVKSTHQLLRPNAMDQTPLLLPLLYPAPQQVVMSMGTKYI